METPQLSIHKKEFKEFEEFKERSQEPESSNQESTWLCERLEGSRFNPCLKT
jgi:hypothetical protein